MQIQLLVPALWKVGNKKIEACRETAQLWWDDSEVCPALELYLCLLWAGNLKGGASSFHDYVWFCYFMKSTAVRLCWEKTLDKARKIYICHRRNFISRPLFPPQLWMLTDSFFPHGVQQVGWKARIKYQQEVWKLGKLGPMSSHPLARWFSILMTTLLMGYGPAGVFIVSVTKIDKVDIAFKLGLAEGSLEIGFPCQKMVRHSDRLFLESLHWQWLMLLTVRLLLRRTCDSSSLTPRFLPDLGSSRKKQL